MGEGNILIKTMNGPIKANGKTISNMEWVNKSIQTEPIIKEAFHKV